ncbi:MAG: sensor histidine kinase [Thermoanaerobaculia bacterium]
MNTRRGARVREVTSVVRLVTSGPRVTRALSYHRDMKARFVLIGIAAWTFVAFYFASQAYFNPAFRMRPRWGEAVAINVTYYYLWGASMPLVIWLARRYPLRRVSAFFVHVFASIALTAVQLVLAEAILTTFSTAAYRQEGLLSAIKTAFGVNFHSSLPTYWLILAATLAFDYSRSAARLEAQLSRAQLDALKMQLNPHFLFNTLNSVSSLMYSDVKAADAMLTRLSELLRMTVDRQPAAEIPLDEEIELAQRYLAIEKIRFEERLRVTWEIDAEAGHALVPSLLLQPLVENAIHHGIARSDSGGNIDIRAWRDGAMLRLTVHDDAEVRGEVRERVGLSNTRARVEALHGSFGYDAAKNGFVVDIALPWSVV